MKSIKRHASIKFKCKCKVFNIEQLLILALTVTCCGSISAFAS